METDLECQYDPRKSFYSKARVDEEDGKTILISYNTKVAYIKNGKAFVLGLWSATTSRHVKEFLMQNGFKAETTKQIQKDYGVKEEKEVL